MHILQLFEKTFAVLTKNKYLLISLILGLSIGVILTVITIVVVEHTSEAEFCASCHSIRPLVKAYGDDVHGGNNKTGFRAKCTACHLPPGPVEHILAKTVLGGHDIFSTLFKDPEKIDWKEKRNNREHFTYDSGCKTCHSDLEIATSKNIKAFVAHKPYFLKTIKKKCVSCHENVGHKNIEFHIKNNN